MTDKLDMSHCISMNDFPMHYTEEVGRYHAVRMCIFALLLSTDKLIIYLL